MYRQRFFLVLALLLSLAAGQSAWAQQYARPDGTTTQSGWSPVNAATLHEAVDEPVVVGEAQGHHQPDLDLITNHDRQFSGTSL